MLKSETQKISLYGLIGIILTGLTYLLWTLFIQIGNNVNSGIEDKVWIAGSQFVASFLVIGLSLYLNRKITFKDQQRRHGSKWATVFYFYVVYSLGALLASIVTWILQKITPSLNLEVIKIIGLVVNVGINYGGQRFWIFK